MVFIPQVENLRTMVTQHHLHISSLCFPPSSSLCYSWYFNSRALQAPTLYKYFILWLTSLIPIVLWFKWKWYNMPRSSQETEKSWLNTPLCSFVFVHRLSNRTLPSESRTKKLWKVSGFSTWKKKKKKVSKNIFSYTLFDSTGKTHIQDSRMRCVGVCRNSTKY